MAGFVQSTTSAPLMASREASAANDVGIAVARRENGTTQGKDLCTAGWLRIFMNWQS